MAMALVPAVLTLNVSPCSFSVAVDITYKPSTRRIPSSTLCMSFKDSVPRGPSRSALLPLFRRECSRLQARNESPPGWR